MSRRCTAAARKVNNVEGLLLHQREQRVRRERNAATADDHGNVGGASNNDLLPSAHQDIGNGDCFDLFRAGCEYHQNGCHGYCP